MLGGGGCRSGGSIGLMSKGYGRLRQGRHMEDLCARVWILGWGKKSRRLRVG